MTCLIDAFGDRHLFIPDPSDPVMFYSFGQTGVCTVKQTSVHIDGLSKNILFHDIIDMRFHDKGARMQSTCYESWGYFFPYVWLKTRTDGVIIVPFEVHGEALGFYNTIIKTLL